MCQYFQLGQCRFGDKCRSSHVGTGVAPESTPEGLPTAAEFRERDVVASAAPSFVPACKFFVQGRCNRGAGCIFTHSAGDVGGKANPTPARVPPELPQPDVADAIGINNPNLAVSKVANTPRSSLPVRAMYHCIVRFGLGAAVENITTTFESTRVILSNLLPSITDLDIISLLPHHTRPSSIQIHPKDTHASAVLEFTEVQDATEAVERLGREVFEGQRIVARLDLRNRAAENGTGTLLSRKVKINWFSPTFSASAKYSNATEARREASRLDGMKFQGRHIKAVFKDKEIGSRRRGGFIRDRSFSSNHAMVLVTNLPPNSSLFALQGFCNAMSITLHAPKFDIELVQPKLRSLLTQFGPVETFDILPNMDPDSAKNTAFVQFVTAEAASAAVKGLKDVSQDFLGQRPVLIHQVHSVKYTLTPNQYRTIRTEVHRLKDAHLTDPRVRIYDHGLPTDAITILVNGSDPKTIGKVKVDLEKIIHGELLLVAGKEVWDEYLHTEAGQAFVRGVNLRDGAASFLKCDMRTRTIRVFGSANDRRTAKELLLNRLKEIEARRHVVPLRRGQLGNLVRGMLKSFQETYGAEQIKLNVAAAELTISGGPDVVTAIRNALDVENSGISPPSTQIDTLCPVCFCDITEPLGLPCGHFYCTTCLQHLLYSTPSSGFSPLTCIAEVPTPNHASPSSVCGVGIPYEILREHLSSAEETRVLRQSLVSHIQARPSKYRYCPTPDCEVIYRPGPMGTVYQCPACLISICGACHAELHDGLSCADYQDELAGGSAALERWRAENNIKQCPKCRADIEKNGGCNHITCANCKTHICWVCLKTFVASGDVYPHMNREHGGIGIGFDGL
ncbi:hypothetical protein HGRIS_010334 [Hohenbuehelia grisea]|uniref:RBR-type E3 ubiquitin transferase n=1 Tax=Hohenbuehelia grisea TaxID=104357 RepID=A0ABR3J4E7_9AGAR